MIPDETRQRLCDQSTTRGAILTEFGRRSPPRMTTRNNGREQVLVCTLDLLLCPFNIGQNRAIRGLGRRQTTLFYLLRRCQVQVHLLHTR